MSPRRIRTHSHYTLLTVLLLVASTGLDRSVLQASADTNGSLQVDHGQESATARRIISDLSQQTEAVGSGPRVRSTPDERAWAAGYLADALVELGLDPQLHRYKQPNVNPLVDLLLPPMTGTNVFANLESSVASRDYIVLGAHYDSDPGSPGAGDNAAGVALIYSLASRLEEAARGRNLVIVFFDQEEDDEVGSRAFVEFLRESSWNVHSVHICDVAAWDGNGDGVVEVQLSPDRSLEAVYRQASQRTGVPVSFVGGSGASDNKSFADAGYATAGVWSNEITPHMHKPTDTVDTVDLEFLAAATDLMSEVLTTLLGAGSTP